MADGTRQWVVRALVAVLVLSAGVVAVEFVAHARDPAAGDAAASQARQPYAERRAVAPPANGTTVITVQKFRRNFVVAFAPDGRVRYFDNSLDRYHDVDPVPEGTHTVEFVGAEYDGDTTHLLVRRVNLTTGATRDVYRHAVPRTDRPHRWHDVDRLDAHRLLVADIRDDAVFVVNTTTGERTYEWPAQAHFDTESGGQFPRDWTHLNDVERLPDGRYMASLRNQDAVVFVEPGRGVDASWTLGRDDAHGILYEQHNPDYLPGAEPSVLVADSQNRRIVEYRRENGSWVRTWSWRDEGMAWPRDADRLPNGHTLIGDTNSGRVLEIDETGTVVWRVDGLPSYDVERLGTGDESAGGRSAERLGLANRSPAAGSPSTTRPGRTVIPTRVSNTVAFVSPLWLSATGRAAAVVGLVAALALALPVVGGRLRRVLAAAARRGKP
ncbi:arylsulfotransferase family protein [Haloplanus salinarum]|uniref:arylsulfotransferase family protein n=1 Tax=Haloplanus salinarum TaxID=1912324 RepID=UPI00214BCF86|nr:arylsulfotransferase family protein [Haloplanus salinarum]